MINLVQNPELVRNARIQLRPRKVVAVVLISALLSISLAYLYFSGQAFGPPLPSRAMNLLVLVLSGQALILAAGGSIACLGSIFREKELKSFDFQRVTRLTPLELALGKLFGAPILMYFVCLCLMPLSLLAAFVAKPRATFYLAAYAVLLVASLALHALSLLMSVLSVRGSQTGGIILVLILLSASSFSGDMWSASLLKLGSLGAFFAPQLVNETSWLPKEIEKTTVSGGTTYTLNNGMTDVFFGLHVHHFPVLLVLNLLFTLWFLLAIVRNVKRDPAEYEVYSPAQSLGFAFFLNLVFLSFFNWTDNGGSDSQAILLSFNLGVFSLLGLVLIRNRDRMRRILHARQYGPSWLDVTWPAFILFLGSAGAGVLVLVGAFYSGVVNLTADRPFFLFRCVFFGIWLVRDVQFLQWMSLRKGRSPLVMGVVYLLIFYVCASISLAAAGAGSAFSAFFLPTPVYQPDTAAGTHEFSIIAFAVLLQIVAILFFCYLQRRKLDELSGSSLPATTVSQPSA